MPNQQAQQKAVEMGDAYEGNPPDNQNKPNTRQRTDDEYASGVQLFKDVVVGQFSIEFPKEKLDQVGKEFFAESIKPLLAENHQLQNGPQIKFHWDSDTKSWNLRFSFVKKDEAGAAIKRADGRNEHVGYFQQANVIVHRVASEIDKRLAEKLGIAKSAGVPF